MSAAFMPRPGRVRKVRRLASPGEVLVSLGDCVQAEDILVRSEEPGEVVALAAAAQLGISPAELSTSLKVSVGQAFRQGQCLGRSRHWFGFVERCVTAPFDGILESVSPVTGQCFLRKPPRSLECPAYLTGQVVETHGATGVTVEGEGCLLHGVLGVGGECIGPLQTLEDEGSIQADHRGQVLAFHQALIARGLFHAVEAGARAVIVPSVDDGELTRFLGDELSLAVTGDETLPMTLILTEGFGKLHMMEKMWHLLSQNQGNVVSCSGATQIRAGAIRPEIVLPLADSSCGGLRGEERLEPGMRLRCLREPWFGQTATLVAFLTEPLRLPTESMVPGVRVRFESGRQADLPLANVERVDGVSFS